MKIVTVIGARPQFIKAATVSEQFSRDSQIDEVLVHTGQHFDDNMSRLFFEEMHIPAPKYTLNTGGLNHGAMTGRMLTEIEEILQKEVPDMVLVYGDTNSTLAGALAAAKIHIPVAHVEAGLRSFNRKMPEEVNRVLTDQLSHLLFCPSEPSVENLKREGISNGVHVVGDVMYDAILRFKPIAAEVSTILSDLKLRPSTYCLATIHRAENTDTAERLSQVMSWLENQAREQEVVLPIHPRTRGRLSTFGLEPAGVRLIDPVGYLDMQALVGGASAVFTDSGGLQKEAYFHRVPCVTLRSETEWTETIDAGWNRLWTTAEYAERKEVTAYGEGNAAGKIKDIILAS